MVIQDNGTYQCEICSLHYEDEATAEDCERFCREHDACNTAIISEAVENQ